MGPLRILLSTCRCLFRARRLPIASTVARPSNCSMAPRPSICLSGMRGPSLPWVAGGQVRRRGHPLSRPRRSNRCAPAGRIGRRGPGGAQAPLLPPRVDGPSPRRPGREGWTVSRAARPRSPAVGAARRARQHREGSRARPEDEPAGATGCPRRRSADGGRGPLSHWPAAGCGPTFESA